jgi:phosphatidylglycerophosphate synthase
VPATLSALYPAKVIGMFVATMAIAIAGLRDYHPFPRFGPANVTTTLRALLVAMVVGFIGEPASPHFAEATILIASIAAALDGVDGWLARRTAMASAFGARFDMEIDALLIQALAVLVWQHDKAGAWVLASGLLRYAFVGIGRLLPWMRRPLTPTVRGRAICVVQISMLIVALIPAVLPPASSVVAAAGLVVLCYSFGVDTLWLWRHK